MANIRQQRKRIRTAQRERLENLRYKSAMKTLFRRLRDTVDEGDDAAARETAARLESVIDKAAAHNAIHKNKAARKKTQLARVLTEL